MPMLISLAVIVKDQAELLDRLLSRHAGVYDEAVVVDTGSTDGSPGVVVKHCARLVEHRWRDDFSAARNAGLERCRGRWILVLDCDEALAPQDGERLRATIRSAAPCGFALPQWSYTDDDGLPDWQPTAARYAPMAAGATGYVPVHGVRVFPRLAGVRYQGPVHESVEQGLRGSGLDIRRIAVPVHHQGYRLGVAANAERIARNGRLLREKIRSTPHCPATRRELAVQLIAEGQDEVARRLLTRTVAESPGGREVARSRRLLARLLVLEGRHAEAAEQCEHALRERPDAADGWLDAARMQAVMGDRRRAERILARGRWLFPRDRRLAALQSQVLMFGDDNDTVETNKDLAGHQDCNRDRTQRPIAPTRREERRDT